MGRKQSEERERTVSRARISKPASAHTDRRLVRPRHARAHADVKARHARRAAGLLVFRRTPTPASTARMISLTVQPRIQKEKWSLYWRESMMTKTEVLDPVTLKVDAANETVDAVLAKLATQMHWQPASDLLRLEGFEEPWELAVFKGKECLGSSTLADCGITGDETITTVRKVLVAEGWRIQTGADDDSSTDEEDF